MNLLTASVGAPRAINAIRDVRAVQILLNLNRSRMPSTRVGDVGIGVSGRIDADTIAAIIAFQTKVVGMADPDGIVSAKGGTINQLIEGAPHQLTADVLHLILIEARRADIDKYFLPLSNGMAANQIDTPLRVVHFLAQLGHESGAFRYSEELASGEAYEGRASLGNNQPGDGVRFKGRGLIQITGRANYRAYSKARGVDYLSTPQLLATDPAVAVDSAIWYWNTRNLNTLADDDDVDTITRRINGGDNGLPDRKEKLARGRCFLVR